MSSVEYVSLINQLRGVEASITNIDNKIQGNSNQAVEALSTAAKSAVNTLYLALLAYNPI